MHNTAEGTYNVQNPFKPEISPSAQTIEAMREVTILEFTAPRCAQEMGRHFMAKNAAHQIAPIGSQVNTKYGTAVVVARGKVRNGLFCCDIYTAQRALSDLLREQTGKEWSNGI